MNDNFYIATIHPNDVEICDANRQIIEELNDKEFILDDFNYNCTMNYINVSFDNKSDNYEKSIIDIISNSNLIMKNPKSYIKDEKNVSDQLLTMVDEYIAKQDMLYDAFNNRSFFPYFQPIYSTAKDRQLSHYEVLSRVVTAEKTISAGYFIDTLNDMGKVTELDCIILDKLCEHIRKGEIANTSLFINITPKSLVDYKYNILLRKLLKTAEFKKNCNVTLEITEQTLCDNKDLILEINETYGVYFAIDDFGTGYSNLAVVAELAELGVLSCIKIDGSLISKIENSERMKAIIAFISKLSEEFQLSCVAEYIDNENILDTVTEMGIPLVQGFFYLGKPECIEQVFG